MKAFEYWKSSRDKKWYFHLKAPNNQIICASQGYTTKHACLNGIESIKKNAKTAKIIEIEK